MCGTSCCRLKKNHRFNGQAVRAYRRHPYWADIGWLTGGLKVLVVSHGAKDLRHQSPDIAGRRGASRVPVPRLGRSRPRFEGSTRADRLSSAFGARAAVSSHLLCGGILRAGA
jgi:hypothetical protein